MYKDFTKIKLYGCEFPPYHLPVFLPIKILCLEFIRQCLIVDQTHFLPRKKEAMFKLKEKVGPFIVNTKATNKEVEYLLAQMKLKLGVSWPNDPIGRISIIRV